MKPPTSIPKTASCTGFARACFFLALPALSSLGFAQNAVPAPATEADVVKLSPFTVTTEKDSGYRASNSIAGTRSNTPIKDIPLNIQVFTKDFYDDLLITNQVDLERYNAALVNGNPDAHSDNPIQQAYNAFLFRGFIQNWGLRDGIRQYDPIDTQGLSRVEIVKGPAAALYGLAYPGGIMNSITKEVDFNKNFTALRFTMQNEGEYRASIDTNYSGQVAGGKFGIRFNAANTETRDERAHSDGTIQFAQVNINWMPTPTTELKFLAETGYRDKPNGLGYFSRGEGLGNGADIPLQIVHPNISWKWNWADGINMRTAEDKLYRGTVNQTIGENLQVTAYFQFADKVQVDSEGWDASGGGGSGASWDALSGTGWITLPDGTEIIRKAFHHRDWDNSMHGYGATGVYKLDLGAVKNTLTVGGNAWSEFFISHKGTQPGNTTNFADFAVSPNISTATPLGPPPDYFMDVAGAYGHEKNSNDYYFASWQLATLENRLKLNFAINHTNLKLIQWASGTSTTATITEAKKNSPMIGGMYDITKEISVFALHSTSLFPTTDKNDFFVQMPAVVGKSYEAGLKVELLNGKISGTVSYYEITQTGGSQRDPSAFNLKKQQWDAMTAAQRAIAFPGLTRDELTSASGQPGDLVPGAEQKSKGFEADLIFQPTREWQVMFSYAHNNQEVTSAINAATIGQATSGHIKDQCALLTKYSFTDGEVKGLSVGVGVQGAGQALQDYSGPGNSARYNPSTFYAEVFAGYKFKVLGYNSSVQLNVKNLTKVPEYVGWKATGSSTIIATQRYEVPTALRYSLTFGLDF